MDPQWASQLGWVLLAWTLVTVADYASTIASARLYLQGVHEHIAFEGSLELTPAFQKDVDQLRWFSPRFALTWLLASAGLAAVWWLSVVYVGWVQPMQFLMGAVLLREAAILLRHARNLVLFGRGRGSPELEGYLRYRRPLMLYLSAGELWSYAAFYALLSLALSSWFMAGGAVACGVTGWQHWRMSRAASRALDAPAGTGRGTKMPGP
jgi:hypothetical protein